MRGLPVFQQDRGYESTEKKTLWSSILEVFKGPRKPESTQRYRDEKEKKYHHTPTHAGSSFLRTATTPAMIPAIQAQKKQEEEQSALGQTEGETQVAHQSQNSS